MQISSIVTVCVLVFVNSLFSLRIGNANTHRLHAALGQPAQESVARPFAQGGGTGPQISGAKLELTAEPGQVYVHTMQVGIGADSQPMDIQITARGFGENVNGEFQALTAERDTSPYSGRKWITAIDSPKFRLNPGETRPVAVTITVPTNPGSSARYATLFVDSQVAAENQEVTQKFGVIVPIVITPVAAQKNLSATLAGLDMGPIEAGKPITIAATLTNTGSYHFKVKGVMTITNAEGRAIAQLPIPLTSTSLIPTFARRLQVSYAALDLPQGLPAGSYRVEAQLNREDDSLVGKLQTTFEVTLPFKLCPDVPDSDVLIKTFKDQKPDMVDAGDLADLQMTFEDTGKVTGQVAICKYTQEPVSEPRLSSQLGEGGVGGIGLKFVLVQVSGFRQGTAHLAFRYRDADLGRTSANSLFIAFRDASTWRKLDRLSVQTGPQLVLGEMPVADLAQSTFIALGGDRPGLKVAKEKSLIEPPVDDSGTSSLLLAGLASLIVIVPVASVVLIRKAMRSQQS